MHNLGRKDL